MAHCLFYLPVYLHSNVKWESRIHEVYPDARVYLAPVHGIMHALLFSPLICTCAKHWPVTYWCAPNQAFTAGLQQTCQQKMFSISHLLVRSHLPTATLWRHLTATSWQHFFHWMTSRSHYHRCFATTSAAPSPTPPSLPCIIITFSDNWRLASLTSTTSSSPATTSGWGRNRPFLIWVWGHSWVFIWIQFPYRLSSLDCFLNLLILLLFLSAFIFVPVHFNINWILSCVS